MSGCRSQVGMAGRPLLGHPRRPPSDGGSGARQVDGRGVLCAGGCRPVRQAVRGLVAIDSRVARDPLQGDGLPLVGDGVQQRPDTLGHSSLLVRWAAAEQLEARAGVRAQQDARYQRQ